MNKPSYIVTHHDWKSGKHVKRTYPFDGDPVEFVKKVAAGDPDVWHRKDFGQKHIKFAKVSHYVGGSWSANGTGRCPEFSIDYGKAFPVDFDGNPTMSVEFFKDLHTRLQVCLDNAFTHEEQKYITANITDVVQDCEQRKYSRSFAAAHVYGRDK